MSRLAALVPGGLAIYLGFNAGGFFAGTTGIAALVLVGVLIVAGTLTTSPLAGLSVRLFAAVAAMACLCVWTLASGFWSGSPARALLEFDRSLLYLLSLVAFALLVRGTASVRWLARGLAVAAVVLCSAGLVTRLLPQVWHVALDPVAEGRLSFPVSYWNALGLGAGLGIVLCAAMTTSRREPPLARVLGAAAMPILATALYFTFSRGALLATFVGLVAFLLAGRPSAVLGGAGATVPTTALAVGVSIGADRLSSSHPSGQVAIGQGHRVAVFVALSCLLAGTARALLVRVDDRVRIRPPRHALRTAGAVIAVGAIGALVALGASGGGLAWLDHQRDQLLAANGIHHTDQRQRLVDLGNNGRVDAWRVAIDAFADSPITGTGAGTYENTWSRDRPASFNVVDAHSLYVESLAELGIPGFALVIAVVIGILWGLARRCRGTERALYAGLFGAALAWALHAGVDWDWEMPVVTLWVFAAGGAALAGDRPRRSLPSQPSRVWRVVAGLGLLALAVTPASIAISQSRLDAGVSAFRSGDCQTATDEALGASSILAVRPEPYELLAYCDARAGLGPLGARMIDQAISRDPQSWELRYGRAIVLGFAGRDPAPALAKALQLNPREPVLHTARAEIRRSSGRPAPQRRRLWQHWATSARLPI